MRTAIRKHLKDFAAVIGLIVVAIAVSSVILSNQRLTLPGWVPVIGKDFYEIEAELSTAQAVTPGQGQTVNVAGVPVGQIAKAEVKNGVARITLDITTDAFRERYDRARRIAIDWLRDSVKREGLEGKIRVGDKDATKELIDDIDKLSDLPPLP